MQLNHGPGLPFTRTADLEDLRMSEIHRHHHSGSPLTFMIKSRLFQLTDSNAFGKSVELQDKRRHLVFVAALHQFHCVDKIFRD